MLYKVTAMSLFDLLFIFLLLAAVSTLLATLWFAVCRKFNRARRSLVGLLVGTAAYMMIVIVVSLILPRRVVKLGDSQCFDDWCLSVAGFRRMPEGTRVEYIVDLQLSSRALRISQRENNVTVYLTDKNGRRYEPVADKTYVPFNVLLRPQESVKVSRSFLVPGDAAEVGAVITHEGGFPIGWFIIGYDTWFRKPPFVRLT
ncbi:MAG: hypothetical protein ACYDCG_15265 [Candidatus Acidiferrales bacterium]